MLKDLNQKQLKAVKEINGPVAVIAGAGTGKTRTLTYRIANMINEGIYPHAILAMTFTNKAAREMKERVVSLVGEKAYETKISTFHSFCAAFLRDEIHNLNEEYTRRFLIIDEEDSKQIIRDTVKELNYDNNKFNSNRLKSIFSMYKNKQIDYLDNDEILIYQKYNEYLRLNNALDFDDLIMLTIKVLKTNPKLKDYYNKTYTHILIDEFQDTNIVQYNLIKLLVGENNNVFVVGDPDQSIYSFRGANYANLELFLMEFKPEVIILDENYRSKESILEVANKLISNATDRPEKNLESSLGEGFPVIYDVRETDRDEAYFVLKAIEIFKDNNYNLNDIAVLYRANSLSRVFEEAFLKEGLPYKIYGGLSFFDRKEIKDILAYLRLAINEHDNISFKRIVNMPRRKIGPTTISKLEAFGVLHKMSLFEAIEHISLPSGAINALKEFREIIYKIRKKIENVNLLSDVIDIVRIDSGYQAMLESEGHESKDRIENVLELKAVFHESATDYNLPTLQLLEETLNDISLKTDLDRTSTNEAVTLATIHQVKGLEFKVVFVVALEEGIFPSVNSMTFKELEEERRVFYVAITRAIDRLVVSRAKQRYRFGEVRHFMPSKFLMEAGLIEEDTYVQVKDIKEIKYQEKEDLNLGDRIEHDKYGKGVIVQLEDDKIVIAFALEHGIKTFKKDHPSISKAK